MKKSVPMPNRAAMAAVSVCLFPSGSHKLKNETSDCNAKTGCASLAVHTHLQPELPIAVRRNNRASRWVLSHVCHTRNSTHPTEGATSPEPRGTPGTHGASSAGGRPSSVIWCAASS
jgi:hypothetical protein